MVRLAGIEVAAHRNRPGSVACVHKIGGRQRARLLDQQGDQNGKETHPAIILAHADRSVTPGWHGPRSGQDRKSTRLNSSHLVISYAVFCLKKKTQKTPTLPL